MENIEKSGRNKKNAKVRGKSGKSILSQSEVIEFCSFLGEHAPRSP